MEQPYVFTEDMDEISGFGGGYEDACRRMLIAGILFLEATFPAELDKKRAWPPGPDESAYSRLQDACAAVEEGCSGAMVGASSSHAVFVWKNGWPAYVEKMKARKVQEEAERPQREAEDRVRREKTQARLEKIAQSQQQWLELTQGAVSLEDYAPEALPLFLAVRWRPQGKNGPMRLVAAGGSDISDVCRDLFTLAQGLKREVVLNDFNGVSVSSRPEDTSWKDACARWHADREVAHAATRVS